MIVVLHKVNSIIIIKQINTLTRFWPILDQHSYIFMKKENEFSCLFIHNVISNGLYHVIRNNIDQNDN